jgi:3-deoxy-manno-octulosonate cytidylyltransferase (CMP-KDO synthetase)
MSAIVIIPCRYASTRFPGKPLQSLMGKPLIQHVYERSARAKNVKRVFAATDSDAIIEVVKSFRGNAVKTSDAHQSGTDRVAEAFLKISEIYEEISPGDIVVNVQGDEPMIMPEMVDDVIRLLEDKRANMATIVKRIESYHELIDVNTVKAVFDAEGFALYFSRSPIPYYRDEWKDITYAGVNRLPEELFKHIGIYAYSGEFLLKFTKLPVSRLENIEKLEQLRAIEHGYRIKIALTQHETIGVDTPEDLERVRKCLSISS